MILLVVLYGYGTLSLTLREEHMLRVFENSVLVKVFGPKTHEVTRTWRRLHNEKLCDLYCSPSKVRLIKSRRMRWTGHVARIVGKLEGRRPLIRPRRRWENTIKMNFQKVRCGPGLV